jgi:hypothetical protein
MEVNSNPFNRAVIGTNSERIRNEILIRLPTTIPNITTDESWDVSKIGLSEYR